MATAAARAPMSHLEDFPRVLIVEAVAGNERRRWLDRRLKEAALPGARIWMLSCDFELGGPWAGAKDLFSSLFAEIQAKRPDLVERHARELIYALPHLKGSLRVRNLTLTDLARGEERTRNYAPDRALRIVHGLIDLLDAWKTSHEGDIPWLIACDSYCQSGAIGARFFRELMRRRGEQLKIQLLVGVDQGRGMTVRSSFHAGVMVAVQAVNLPVGSPASLAPDVAEQQASALEQKIGNDLIEREVALPELIRFWHWAGRPDKVLRYRYLSLETCNAQGLYADALRYGQGLMQMASEYATDDKPLRWRIITMLLACYLATQDVQAALHLAEGEGARFVECERPLWRGQLCYLIAMAYVRYSKRRDLAKGEEYLDRGLAWIQSDNELSEADLHLNSVFNRAGLALIRNLQGRHQEAIDLCQSGTARLNAHLHPEAYGLQRSVLIYNIAQVYVASGSDEDAIRYYSAAIEMDPNHSEYYNERGSIFLRLRRLEDARADYLQAIELSPPYFEVFTNLGQCYRLIGAMAQAIEAYSQALDLEPDQMLALLGRAKAHEELGHVELAIADYTAAVVRDPAQWEAIASRGVLYYEAGNLLEALADFDRALELKPDEPDLYQNRAVVLDGLGRHQEAASDLEAALNLQSAR